MKQIYAWIAPKNAVVHFSCSSDLSRPTLGQWLQTRQEWPDDRPRPANAGVPRQMDRAVEQTEYITLTNSTTVFPPFSYISRKTLATVQK
jgi:hypothetical protein